MGPHILKKSLRWESDTLLPIFVITIVFLRTSAGKMVPLGSYKGGERIKVTKQETQLRTRRQAKGEKGGVSPTISSFAELKNSLLRYCLELLFCRLSRVPLL